MVERLTATALSWSRVAKCLQGTLTMNVLGGQLQNEDSEKAGVISAKGA